MKSFFKKTASKINNLDITKKLEGASMKISQKVQTIIKKDKQYKSLTEVLMTEATNENGNIVPVSLLNQIAQASFDIEQYEEIIYFLMDILENQPDKTNKVIRALLIIDYLLKHGASACIDEFNDQVHLFKYYFDYNYGKEIDKKELKQKDNRISGMGSNSKQIVQLQSKKDMEKMKMKSSGNKKKIILNMQDFVENYVFKYLDKANENIDEIANDVNTTIEAYIDYVKQKYFQDHQQNQQNQNNDQEAGEDNDTNYALPEACIELEENEVHESMEEFNQIQKQKNNEEKAKQKINKKNNTGVLQDELKLENNFNSQEVNNGNVQNQSSLSFNPDLLNLEDNSENENQDVIEYQLPKDTKNKYKNLEEDELYDLSLI